MACVEKTQAVTKAMADKNWELACALRGAGFMRNLETYRMLSRLKPPALTGNETGWRLAIINVGAPCCGMNAAARSFVRNCIHSGAEPYGVHNGIDGLIKGEVAPLSWSSVTGWVVEGGSLLGCKRTSPSKDLKACADTLEKFKIQGIVVIGGFEAFDTVLQLSRSRKDYKPFRVPMVVLPATISNNVPGTEFSVGADTALNSVVDICDRIRQSATGTKRRVFIIETMGGYCGYLASMAALSGGADVAYINEEKFGIKEMSRDMEILMKKMDEGNIFRGLVLMNEKANPHYNTDFLYRMYSEEGKDHFTVRHNILGHSQQGGIPSPFDRAIATSMGAKAVIWLNEQLSSLAARDGTVHAEDPPSATVLGMDQGAFKFHPVEDLAVGTDFEKRLKEGRKWWMDLRAINGVLAQHDSSYD